MFPDSNVKGNDSIHWLYDTMANLYKQWLPQEAQQKTLRDGGYYSVRKHLFGRSSVVIKHCYGCEPSCITK